MTEKQVKALRELYLALTEWPCGWHNEKAGGGLHYQVDYTVAKARRMARVMKAAEEAFPTILESSGVK